MILKKIKYFALAGLLLVDGVHAHDLQESDPLTALASGTIFELQAKMFLPAHRNLRIVAHRQSPLSPQEYQVRWHRDLWHAELGFAFHEPICVLEFDALGRDRIVQPGTRFVLRKIERIKSTETQFRSKLRLVVWTRDPKKAAVYPFAVKTIVSPSDSNQKEAVYPLSLNCGISGSEADVGSDDRGPLSTTYFEPLSLQQFLGATHPTFKIFHPRPEDFITGQVIVTPTAGNPELENKGIESDLLNEYESIKLSQDYAERSFIYHNLNVGHSSNMLRATQSYTELWENYFFGPPVGSYGAIRVAFRPQADSSPDSSWRHFGEAFINFLTSDATSETEKEDFLAKKFFPRLNEEVLRGKPELAQDLSPWELEKEWARLREESKERTERLEKLIPWLGRYAELFLDNENFCSTKDFEQKIATYITESLGSTNLETNSARLLKSLKFFRAISLRWTAADLALRPNKVGELPTSSKSYFKKATTISRTLIGMAILIDEDDLATEAPARVWKKRLENLAYAKKNPNRTEHLALLNEVSRWETHVKNYRDLRKARVDQAAARAANH